QERVRSVPAVSRVGPAGRRSRRVRPLPEELEGCGDRAWLFGQEVEHAERRDDQLVRCLEFGRVVFPRLRQGDERLVYARQVTVGLAISTCDALYRFARGIVGNEMAHELRRKMRSRRGMPRQVRENRARLLHTLLRVALSENRLWTRFVQRLAELEAAGFTLCEGAARASDRPAGERSGEGGHVRLGVPSVHAQRVELEDFPREIFIDVE